jgi:hypothetical protein
MAGRVIDQGAPRDQGQQATGTVACVDISAVRLVG